MIQEALLRQNKHSMLVFSLKFDECQKRVPVAEWSLRYNGAIRKREKKSGSKKKRMYYINVQVGRRVLSLNRPSFWPLPPRNAPSSNWLDRRRFGSELSHGVVAWLPRKTNLTLLSPREPIVGPLCRRFRPRRSYFSSCCEGIVQSN